MATITTAWHDIGNWSVRVRCVEKSQDVANNRTTATFTLQLRWDIGEAFTHCDGNYSITINGTTYSHKRATTTSLNVSNGITARS